MKPFSVSKGLAGQPISFKGYKAYLHCSKKEEHVFIVESAVSNMVWSPIHIDELSECTMWEEPRPTVTITLPCPLKEPQPNMWYINADREVVASSYENYQYMTDYDLRIFGKGFYFATKEDAQAWLDAMRNNRK